MKKNIIKINISSLFFVFSFFCFSFTVNASEVITIKDLMKIDSLGNIIYINPLDSKEYNIKTIEDIKNLLIEKNVALDNKNDFIDDVMPFSDEIKKPNTIIKNENLLSVEKINNLINKERTKNNIKELSVDNILTKTAEEHCMDFVNNNYFSHYDKNGKGPKNRAIANGFKSTLITEIIYWGNSKKINTDSSSQEAMDWWIEDEPHRLNIVNKNFKYFGSAVCKKDISSGYKNYFVTMFGN